VPNAAQFSPGYETQNGDYINIHKYAGLGILNNVPITQQGQYIFTAVYPQDSNYSAYSWGDVTVCLTNCKPPQ
jgi:hypothetical protein